MPAESVPWSQLAARHEWGLWGCPLCRGRQASPSPPGQALPEGQVPPRSVRAAPVGRGVPRAAPAWPHRKLLLLLAWELPTPGCSGLCRFCRGRTDTTYPVRPPAHQQHPRNGCPLAPGPAAAAWAKLGARRPLGWAQAGNQTVALLTHLLFLLFFLLPLPLRILLFFLLFLLVVGIRGGFWGNRSSR